MARIEPSQIQTLLEKVPLITPRLVREEQEHYVVLLHCDRGHEEEEGKPEVIYPLLVQAIAKGLNVDAAKIDTLDPPQTFGRRWWSPRLKIPKDAIAACRP